MKHGKWRKIGNVGVDSGQLMVCDPCYLDGWIKGDYKDIRIYHDKDGNLFGYDTKASREIKATESRFKKMELFKDYQTRLSTGKTPNQHSRDNEWTEIEVQDDSFSYNGVSHKPKKQDYKQINYALGHPGLAVSMGTCYGDGYFPVYGRFIKDGDYERLAEFRVITDGNELDEDGNLTNTLDKEKRVFFEEGEG